MIDFFKVVTDFTILQVSSVSSLGRICPEVLEEKILKSVNAFLLFCNYLPFEKGLGLHVKKKLNPMLCAKFG